MPSRARRRWPRPRSSCSVPRRASRRARRRGRHVGGMLSRGSLMLLVLMPSVLLRVGQVPRLAHVAPRHGAPSLRSRDVRRRVPASGWTDRWAVRSGNNVHPAGAEMLPTRARGYDPAFRPGFSDRRGRRRSLVARLFTRGGRGEGAGAGRVRAWCGVALCGTMWCVVVWLQRSSHVRGRDAVKFRHDFLLPHKREKLLDFVRYAPM